MARQGLLEPWNSDGYLPAHQCWTTILVDRATAPLIINSGILTEGRTQFTTLHLPDNSKMTMINTYALRSSRDRAPLWKKISEAEFLADHTILGGDFNHLEEEDSRGRAGERRMHRKEVVAWHNLTLQYGLMDAWNLDNFKKNDKKSLHIRQWENGRWVGCLQDRQAPRLPGDRSQRRENRIRPIHEKDLRPLPVNHDDLGAHLRPANCYPLL